jgi:hypothetical protein
MTDTTAGETPVEPVPPIPEAASPEAAAELDAGRLEVDGPAPAEVPTDAPVLPEIEYPIGSTRQAVLDHFLDSEGDQSVAQIIAELVGADADQREGNSLADCLDGVVLRSARYRIDRRSFGTAVIRLIALTGFSHRKGRY